MGSGISVQTETPPGVDTIVDTVGIGYTEEQTVEVLLEGLTGDEPVPLAVSTTPRLTVIRPV